MFDVVFGTLFGFVVGLLPGVHPNLMATLFVGFGARFVVAAALAQVVSGAFPLLLFGVPSSENVFVVHPVERLRRRGLAFEAVKLLVLGCVLGVLLCVVLTPLLLWVLPLFQVVVGRFVRVLLFLSLVVLVLYEPSLVRKLGAVVVLFCAGVLGVVVLSSEVGDPLLVLFSGLFGVPALFVGFFSGGGWVVQRRTDVIRPSWFDLFGGLVGGVVSVLLLSFIPAMSMAQASLLALFVVRVRRYVFLVVLGCVGVLDYYFSLLFAVLFGRTRAGVFEIVGSASFSQDNLFGFVGVVVFAVCVSGVLLLWLFPFLERLARCVSRRLLFAGVFLFVVVLALGVSGSDGFVVLGGASLVGVLALVLGVSRTHLMGCLSVPLLMGWVGL